MISKFYLCSRLLFVLLLVVVSEIGGLQVGYRVGGANFRHQRRE